MEKYSKEQQVLIVKIHYQNGKSFTATVRKLFTMHQMNSLFVISKFEETGSTVDIISSGRPRSDWIEVNVVTVRDFVTASPENHVAIVLKKYTCLQSMQKICTNTRLKFS